MSLEECPAKARLSSTSPADDRFNWRACPMTSRTIPCRICGSVTLRSVLCSKNWWVCNRCYSRHCPKLHPENPNAIIGKVVWIEA